MQKDQPSYLGCYKSSTVAAEVTRLALPPRTNKKGPGLLRAPVTGFVYLLAAEQPFPIEAVLNGGDPQQRENAEEADHGVRGE